MSYAKRIVERLMAAPHTFVKDARRSSLESYVMYVHNTLTEELCYVYPQHAMAHAFCFAKEAYFGIFYKYLQGEEEVEEQEEEER